MAEIYFGCSKQGGFARVSQDELRGIYLAITGLGHHVLFDHTSPTFMADDKHMTPQDIHDRDYSLLIAADAGVFEISNASTGVGGEISDCVHLGKPALCLFKAGLEKVASAYAVGKQGSRFIKVPFSAQAYNSVEHAREIIGKFLNENV